MKTMMENKNLKAGKKTREKDKRGKINQRMGKIKAEGEQGKT